MRALKITIAISLMGLVGLALAPSVSAQAYDDWNPKLEGFPSNTPESPRSNCAGGAHQCIERTIGEMWNRFHKVVPSCDHNNVFPLTYLRVTEDIRIAIDEGFYDDLLWINKQDAMFARIYFLTYSNWLAGRMDLVPESWQTTFNAGRDQTVEGIGNLLLSMNAHINRDFPFILYHAGLANPDGSTKKPDHDKYNPRLRALYKPMLTELAHRFDESIDDYDIPGIAADDDAFFELLVQWRESTWQNATRLAEAANDAERRAVAQDIEDYANGWAALIYNGARYGPGEGPAARNARCAEFGGQHPGYKRGADVARPIGKANLNGAGKLAVRVRCPNGPGPCRGRLKVRRPRKAGVKGVSDLELIGSKRYDLEIGETARLRVNLGRAADPLRAHRRRGVWLAARSKLGPKVAVTKRRKARLGS